MRFAAIPVVLSMLGLFSLFNISPPFNIEGNNMFESIFFKQLLFLCISIILMIVVSNIHYGRIRTTAYLWYAISLVLLIAVLLLAKNIRGARSWFKVGMFSFQPSEFARMFLIIAVAKYLSSKEALTAKNVIIVLFLAVVPIALISVQPDFGMAMLTMATIVTLLFATGIRLGQMIPVGVAVLILCPLIYLFGLRDYQKERITAAFSIGTTDSRYQVEQSMKAIISGGVVGKGIGQSSMTMPYYVPDRHNDFIFSHICEELGIVGSASIMILFGFYFVSCLRSAFSTRDLFARYLILGLCFGIFLQFFINISMTIGIFPVTGLNLPFVSYGGSGLLSAFLSAGIILSITRRWRPEFSETRLPESSFTITTSPADPKTAKPVKS